MSVGNIISNTRRGQTAGPIDVRTEVPEWAGRIPAELRDRPQWVVWKYENRKGKRTKIPYQSLQPFVEAKANSASTWSTFADALSTYLERPTPDTLGGIGYVFAEDDPYTGIDLDNCLKDGEVLEWARPFLDDLMPSYAEISPSGNGIKVWVRASLPGNGTRKNGLGDGSGCVEVYDRTRYFAVTGNALDEGASDVQDRAEAVTRIYARLKPPKVKATQRQPVEPSSLNMTDSELVEKARKAKNGPKFSALYDSGDTSGHHDDDSSADFALVRLIAWWTGPDPDRIDRIFKSSALYREKWDDRRGSSTYGAETIANALDGMTTFYSPRAPRPPKSARQPADKPPDPPEAVATNAAPPPGPARPQIEVNTERHEVVEAAVRALGADPDLYSRNGSLVGVVREADDEVKLTGKTTARNVAGSPRIIDLSEATIGCRLTRHAVFYQWRKGRSGEEMAVDCHPPDWLIRAVATRKHWEGIRPLDAVAECPFPRPDGSIVETPGYDRQTSTLYAPAIDFPPVPSAPTRDDARAAWGRIASHFRLFPFASEHDRVVVLAGTLTVIARNAIDGPVPGVAVNGNKAGTGKGLLIDGMTMPGIGRPAPTSSYPDDKQEAAKVKVAIAIAGRSVVHFDNLEEGSMYGNGPIDSALTARTVDDRVLGVMKLVGEIPLRTSWFLSGNNVNPCKDAYRRWLVCNLITELEHPERRDDLGEESFHSVMLANRGEIVRDALIILRAHTLAGRPGAGWGPLGSFEDWDRVVRRAVWFASDLDCLATQRKTAEESQDRRDKIALLEGWRELPGGKTGLSTTEAVALVDGNPSCYPTLRDVMARLGQAGKPMTARQLGNRFRALKNNRIGGLMLKEAGERFHSTLWAVEAEGPHEAGPGVGIWGSEGCPQNTPAEVLHSHSDTITYAMECKSYGNGTGTHPSDPQIPTIPTSPSVKTIGEIVSGWPAEWMDRYEKASDELLEEGLTWPANEIESFARVSAERRAGGG